MPVPQAGHMAGLVGKTRRRQIVSTALGALDDQRPADRFVAQTQVVVGIDGESGGHTIGQMPGGAASAD